MTSYTALKNIGFQTFLPDTKCQICEAFKINSGLFLNAQWLNFCIKTNFFYLIEQVYMGSSEVKFNTSLKLRRTVVGV